VEQTRPSQIGVRQEGAIKIGIVKNCATQVRARKICAVKSRVGEVSLRKICSLKVSSRQAGETQESATQRRRAEIYRPPVDRAELPLAQAQSGIVQNRILGRVVLTPSVPRSGTAAQNLDVNNLSQLTLPTLLYATRKTIKAMPSSV
jgi:hypothetical protein